MEAEEVSSIASDSVRYVTTGRGQGGSTSRLPEGRKQRAGESCVELLQEGGGRVWEGVTGCPDPNGAVGAGAPEGKVWFLALRGF